MTGVWTSAQPSRSGQKSELRIASSQTGKPVKTCRVRWSPLVLAAVVILAGLGLAWGVRRERSQVRLKPRLASAAASSASAAGLDAVSLARERLEQFEAS